MSESHIEEIEEMADSIAKLLECPICLEKFKSPRMLPCQHSFCVEPCLKGIADLTRKSVHCAICRKIHNLPQEGVSGIPKNLLLQDLLQVKFETGDSQEIWTGNLQWKTPKSFASQQVFHSLLCKITLLVKDGAFGKSDNWPKNLNMQLVPKSLVSQIGERFYIPT